MHNRGEEKMRRWVTFIVDQSLLFLLLVVAAVGLSAFFIKDLNIEAFPDPAPPIVEIVSIYEGKATEQVERQVTIPLEVALAGMKGMEKINSISLYGLSDIKCKFSYSVDYEQAKQQVINRLADATLPDQVQPSIIPNMAGEVMRYTLVGSENQLDLRTLQDWVVARHLRTADGVEDVSSFGGYVKAYDVTVSPENLAKYGVTLSDILDALSKTNTDVGGRYLELGDQDFMVRGLGLIRDLQDIEDAFVVSKNGQPINIRNVADVSIGNFPRTGIVGLNKKDDVVIGIVTLRKDAQSIPSIKSIHERIKDLNQRILPEGIKVQPFYERWDLINIVVHKVMETAVLGVVLVAFVLLVFLCNFRAAIITAIMIPISLMITMAIMAIRGESANLLSIGAIDFGIIVDIPLILIEDYFRLTKRYGPGSIRAIAKSSEEVGRPIFFSVAIIIIAFIPIFMMKGAEAQIFSPMAKTYIYAILFTVILTFTYLIASQFTFLKRAEDREFSFLAFTRERYVGTVNLLLKESRLVLAVTFIIVLIGLFIGFRSIGSQFLPKMDEGNVYIRIIFPYSISLSKTYENAKKARDYLCSLPEVTTVEFQAGRPEDGTDPTGPFNSEFYVDLKPPGQWKAGLTKEKLEDSVREGLKGLFPNADINVSQYIADNIEEVMSGVKGENSVKIFGEDLAELDKAAKGAKDVLEKTPGVEDVGIFRELGQPNLMIEVRRENASALGLTVQDVLDTVSAAIGGKEVTKVIEGDKSFSLLVRFPQEYRDDFDKIKLLPIVLPDGGIVSLARIANVHIDTGASFVYREDYRRFIPVKFTVTSKDLGGAVKQAQTEASKLSMPKGYYMEWSGIFNEMKESFNRFCVSIPVSIFLILTVLYILYRSVRNVLITMVAPVFAVFAGLMSLLVMHESLSVSSMVGFISLIGVSVLNSSIIVTYYIRWVQKGTDAESSIIQTCRARFRPVLMGGFVASLGLLPAALSQGVGSQIQRPLAIVVVGGMMIGMIIDLLITPLLLKFVHVSDHS